MKFGKKFFLFTIFPWAVSFPAFGQQLSLPPPTGLAEVKYDCMGVSKPDPKFSPLPACEGMKDAVKRPNSTTGAVWSLVARRLANGRAYEVWYDGYTGLLWGDMLDSRYTHDQAVLGGREIACNSEEGKRANAGIQSKTFGVPTGEEFVQAAKDGINQVVPNMTNHVFWSAYSDPGSGYGDVYNINGYAGIAQRSGGYNDTHVRCVGR